MNNLFSSKKAEISMQGILSIFIIITVLVVFTPAFQAIFGLSKDSQHFNCQGYVSASNPALSYNSSLSTDTLACVGSEYGLAFIALVVIFGSIGFLITRGSGNENPVSSQY